MLRRRSLCCRVGPVSLLVVKVLLEMFVTQRSPLSSTLVIGRMSNLERDKLRLFDKKTGILNMQKYINLLKKKIL